MLTETPLGLMKIFLVAGIAVFSLLVGLLVQKILSIRVRKMARRTAVLWDDILIESLRGFVVIWIFLLGLAVILKLVPLTPEPLRLLQRFIGLAGIFSVVLFGVRLSKQAIHVYVDRITGAPTSIFKHFAVTVIYLLGFLIILDYLGVSITPLVTALGVGGLAVALALQDTLSNLFSGLNILMTKTIRPGDYIRVDTGQEGNVTDITWRNTIIRGLDKNLIIIPNSKLGQSIVTNAHLPEKEMDLFFPVTVGYENDLGKVERLTVEVAREVLADPARGVPGFEPYIRYNAFTEFGVQFNVILRIREFTDQYPLKHEFFLKLHERFRKEGVRFPAAARSVRVEEK
jgi:small-conductance mechanosensitive channel